MDNDKKYTWETKKETELWGHDTFDTVEDCILDAKENYADEILNGCIFVGEVEPYTVCVDGSNVIDNLEQQAYDECGECAENWTPSSGVSSEDWKELDDQLTNVVTDWLIKHDDMPSFYNINNIVEVSVR